MIYQGLIRDGFWSDEHLPHMDFAFLAGHLVDAYSRGTLMNTSAIPLPITPTLLTVFTRASAGASSRFPLYIRSLGVPPW